MAAPPGIYEMMQQIADVSPRSLARLASLVQPLEGITPTFGQVFPIITATSALEEIRLLQWLLVKGVKVERWNEQASATGARA